MPTVWGEINSDGAFLPYAKFREEFAGLAGYGRVRVKVDKDRNGRFSALYHLMLGKVSKAVNSGPAQTDVDSLKRWVKLQTGRYDLVQLPKPVQGQTHAIEYRSTSFAKMGEAEFHQFAMDTCKLIARELAPWISQSEEWPEIMAIIASIAPAEATA